MNLVALPLLNTKQFTNLSRITIYWRRILSENEAANRPLNYCQLLNRVTRAYRPTDFSAWHVTRLACVDVHAIGNRRCLSLSCSLRLTASYIVSWGRNYNIVLPVLSSTPSIVSVDSILPYKRETFSVAQEAPRAVESWVKRISSLIETSGRDTSTSASTYPRADSAGGDSFMRHHTYFFKDGNVAFLVRGVQP